MADLFVALGYEQPRLNVHKPGRELDLIADHRLERRRAIAECKATAHPVGGDDLNKFAGKLELEARDRHEDRPTARYFISLSGFTETAIEQESGRAVKIVLLDGSRVIDQLVQGRILISSERAIDLAGSLRASYDHLALETPVELLAHERGWIWALYYAQGKGRTHFALIHSDGTPLSKAIADDVIAADEHCDGPLSWLTCLNPPPVGIDDNSPRTQKVMAAYRQHLVVECGSIMLDGLPADSEVGSRQLRLEHLFVPLHMDLAGEKLDYQPVGQVLAAHPRLVVLAAPGGGKSTLIKRLAVAYSDPTRRAQIDDQLPDRDWLPFFFRCRELRHLARASFGEMLDALSDREPMSQDSQAFRAAIDRGLLDGRALLLVDGLDEISDPGDRAAFVSTLRSALQAYPSTAIVLTSREAGFRHIAAHLMPICTRATLSPFSKDDVARLTIAWHREVVGDTEKTRCEASSLANTINNSDRIRRLAVNPLLLTTLLLVKRWVRSLPTRRAVLYGKAVEVLLMTWNTEAHQPISEEEALPQLCYAAATMMIEGAQKISRTRLAMTIQAARAALPIELGYVSEGVERFVQRVEERSSLLMMTGHDIEDGQLSEFFEFRHLTFQEFLTAKAFVRGWHPLRGGSDDLTSVLEPYFYKDRWREVIPLAAVLSGKAAEGLIHRLTELASRLSPADSLGDVGTPIVAALAACLADEAPARPQTIQEAAAQLVRLGGALQQSGQVRELARGRYGKELLEEASRAFMTGFNLANHRLALQLAAWHRIAESDDASTALAVIPELVNQLTYSRQDRCAAALSLGHACHVAMDAAGAGSLDACRDSLAQAAHKLWPMLFAGQDEQCAAAWALIWVGIGRAASLPASPDVIARLFNLWQGGSDAEIRHLAPWCLVSQQIDPAGGGRCLSIPQEKILSLLGTLTGDRIDSLATFVVAWYRQTMHSRDLTRHLKLLGGSHDDLHGGQAIRELLQHLDHHPADVPF